MLERDPERPRRLNPQVPRNLETICLKCLQKRPDQRYESAAALADDLARFRRHEPIKARRAHLGQRFWAWGVRHPWAVTAATGLLLLVVLAPAELGEKADPLATPAGIKPEWYFLPTYQLLKYFPQLLGLFVAFLPPLFVLIWPFLDRTPERRFSKRPVSVAIGISAIVLAIAFGVLGWLSDQELNLFGTRWQFDHYGMPSRAP